jgi:protein tyrosine phosphatase
LSLDLNITKPCIVIFKQLGDCFSTGVGRTGIFLSLDVFQQIIDQDNLQQEVDIFDYVLRMRENRISMVQTEVIIIIIIRKLMSD